MFNLGLFELTLFGIIALVVLGPDKLPKAARTVGRWYGLFRRTSARLQSEISHELQLHEAQEAIKKELAEIRAAEASIKQQVDKLQSTLSQNVYFDAHTQKNTSSAYDTVDEGALTTSDTPSYSTTTPNAWEQIADTAPAVAPTLPMNNRFFLLGEYDRQRRLPKAPFLPNYQADVLLYQT